MQEKLFEKDCQAPNRCNGNCDDPQPASSDRGLEPAPCVYVKSCMRLQERHQAQQLTASSGEADFLVFKGYQVV